MMSCKIWFRLNHTTIIDNFAHVLYNSQASSIEQNWIRNIPLAFFESGVITALRHAEWSPRWRRPHAAENRPRDPPTSHSSGEQRMFHRPRMGAWLKITGPALCFGDLFSGRGCIVQMICKASLLQWIESLKLFLTEVLTYQI